MMSSVIVMGMITLSTASCMNGSGISMIRGCRRCWHRRDYGQCSASHHGEAASTKRINCSTLTTPHVRPLILLGWVFHVSASWCVFGSMTLLFTTDYIFASDCGSESRSAVALIVFRIRSFANEWTEDVQVQIGKVWKRKGAAGTQGR